MSLAAAYLAALATPEVGPGRLARLVAGCGGLAGLLDGRCPADAFGQEKDGNLLVRLARAVRDHVPTALPAATAAVRQAEELGLAAITREDPGYPPALLQAEVASAHVLFVAGRLPAQVLGAANEQLACAIVGTRRASSFALAYARDLARAAAGRGLTVVSGLALGVDAAAHAGALEAAGSEGATVAVLGGGHARLHPAANRHLARSILERGGAVISEWPPFTNPQPHHFLQRNRVIAGLSKVVVVVEAGVPSGALNTAHQAEELGRQVMAVPSRPNDERNRGALRLLKDGVPALTEVDDLLSHFPAPSGPRREAHAVGGEAFGPLAGLPGAAGLERALTSGEELTLDHLTRASGVSVAQLLPLLGLLELEGRLERTANGRFRLRA